MLERFRRQGQHKAAEAYRVWIFGQGEANEGLDEQGQATRAGVSREAVAEVVAAKGRVPVSEYLRLRVRYFADGTVLGTRAYVNGVFAALRDRFGPKRADGARRMRGVESDATRKATAIGGAIAPMGFHWRLFTGAGSWLNRGMKVLVAQVRGQLDTHLRRTPRLGQGVYLARTAVVLGDVTLGDHASVWYGAVLRGDIHRIEIGHHTNIQDLAVIHLADEFPCLIGNWVTVGHSAIVHACTVGDETLVGMGACLLDGAVIGRQCLIGARALVTPGTNIPDGSLVLGSPARVVRALTDEERGQLKYWAEKYVHNAAYCLQHGINVGGPMGA